MTAPSDEALVYDIIKLKEMGYNTIRKHVKIEAERFYYHCDRLGMMVWQDMPNGGGEYNMVFVTHLPNASDRFARALCHESELEVIASPGGSATVTTEYSKERTGKDGDSITPILRIWYPHCTITPV